MKHVDATVIAIMMPFSSVITGVLSVIIGYDTISSNLIIGAVLGFSAIMLSGLADVFETKKHEKKVNS
jgi:drug/metabolite transporter (DMT)-like permease